ncbi:hypothetical protein GALMADRAFT_114855 [Galerina marginata CBS 339.88]|uniref:DNA repair protein REV1 n=1 Tax=Galerina marginata (strain CBS 339.88) TaxID=685588 RepID=A0A067TFL8_GALM3|nr:hypothetical protein GALMADRAFT_114855 [Galerina marginata CBS 339.88]
MSVVPGASQSNSSDYFEDDDSQFLDALGTAVLPGDIPMETGETSQKSTTSEELEPPPPTQPSLKRRHSVIEIPDDSVDVTLVPAGPEDAIYGASHFGDYGEYMRRKRAKLQIQNAEITESGGSSGLKSQIFKDIAIYVNGWTRPSVQELRRLIVQHGGVFQPYLAKKAIVTHIITCSLTPAKIREFKHMKVVRPEWLTESIEKGYLLSWKDYIYIHEERIEESQGAKSGQTNLLDQPFKASSSASASTNPSLSKSSTGTSPVPKNSATSFLKARKVSPVVDPLYTTDPVNKADAARVPGYAADRSNPNAQRAMANPEWRKAHTSVASDFIDGYYKNSRLHHLSTWKAELKDLVQEAQERAESGPFSGHVGKVDSEASESSGSAVAGVSMRGAELVKKSPSSKWKGKGKAMDDEERVIMHCDFDCFFVSAGLVSRPELKGKPVVVCHSQGAQGGTSSTSEIASSSYEARKFGIKNGMSLQQARQLCPEIITMPYEFERYKQSSLQFYTVLMAHADDLQAVSVDEALIDVTTTVNQLRSQSGHTDPAKDFAETIRAQVRKATSCEISIGVSHNILLARLATRRAKPGGSYHLFPADVPEFLAPLSISDLHGFGWSTKQKAQEKLGVITLGELVKKSKGVLMDALGKSTGETLYNAVRGIDDKQLESDKPRKSVSCEINYGIRFENNEQAEAFIHQMAAEVKKRLDAIDMVGRSITLKIMKRDPTSPIEPPKFLGHGCCDLFNKQMPLIGPGGKATSDDQVIGSHAWRLLKSFNFDPKELRGIGIQVQKLESSAAATSAPAGQAVLPFKAKATSSAAVGTSKDAVAGPQIRVLPPSQDDDVKTGDPVKPARVEFDLPSFSQVDMTVFDALPREVREELENEYKRRSASPFTSRVPGQDLSKPAVPRPQPQPPLPISRRSATPSIFPQKSNKAVDYKRITKQLAPRSRAAISPQKNSVYAWALRERERELERKKKASSVRITEAALRDLNLDPEVFAALPIKVQREQLVMARLIKQKGHIPEPPAERKVLKPRKHELPPDYVVYRAPKPKARHPPPPFLRQQGKDKKEKLYFTETDDIQRIVETWVITYRHWVPRPKDIEFLSKFLVQSVDRGRATDVGVERAVAVMKWWMVLLRRFFPAWECMDEDDLASSQRNTVAEAWWDACHGVQDEMDAITRKRFGGRLSYR